MEIFNQLRGTPAPSGPNMSIRDLIQKPLNYDKYSHLETELNEGNLVDFIQKIGGKYKGELTANVRIVHYSCFLG